MSLHVELKGLIRSLHFPRPVLNRLAETNEADDRSLTPPQLYSWLSRLMYNRRSKIDPLWNSCILGGMTPASSSDPKSAPKPFLGYVDLLGVTYQSSTIATGFGLHLAQPLLRKAVEGREDELTEEEARSILEGCMKVLCEFQCAYNTHSTTQSIIDHLSAQIPTLQSTAMPAHSTDFKSQP